MTVEELRDYFAGQAITGICASGPSSDWSGLELAKEAYSIADAMLLVRSDKPSQKVFDNLAQQG